VYTLYLTAATCIWIGSAGPRGAVAMAFSRENSTTISEPQVIQLDRKDPYIHY